MRQSVFLVVGLSGALWSNAAAFGQADRVAIADFALDRTEVSIGQFRQYARTRNLTTSAEADGGGYEFAAGWTRRPGWIWSAPIGRQASDAAPAVHLSWAEARDFCAANGGRLPTFEEWKRAAYTESRTDPSDGFVAGRTYRYPVGDAPDGMNTSGSDPWPQFAPAGATRRGVNGLHDMGGNVWEWLADRRGGEALTAGGSWWYGPDKAEANAAQWKPAEFYALYIGFRCAYDPKK